jgi:tetratricopeptide (TPR) repeat protein
MTKLVETFQALNRKQILALPVGKYGDYELLSVCEHFYEIDDRDREMAVYELILRSPEVSEMVAYDELYFDLVNYYRWKKKFNKAIQWCYAMLAFSEQHEDGIERVNHQMDLANIYLAKEDFDIGLAMYTQMIHDEPSNVWLYNNLGLELPRVKLSALAVETLNSGLTLVSKDDPEGLKEQFEELRDEAIELAANETSRTDEIDPAVLVNFQNALHLPTDTKVEMAYPPAVARLIELDNASDDADYDEAIANGPVLIPALIQLAYDSENEPGSAHAIAILRTLRDQYPEELTMLTPWLDQADENWHFELLSGQMGKIGGYTTQALREYAANTDNATSIRGCATEALVERANRMPELRDEVISFFRTLFTRPEAYNTAEEQFIAMLIGDSLDLNARELYPEIKQVYDEDRLEPGWVHLDDVHIEWEMPRSPSERRYDGLYLPVLCKSCGRTREHFTEYVLVDTNTLNNEASSEYDAYMLDHAVICPKCRSVDRYKMTSTAYLRMTGPDDIVVMFQSKKDKKSSNLKPNPRVLYFRSAVFGKTMHPLDGLDEYRRRIALNPRDALLRSKMGSLLRTLMRYSEALEAQRNAYQLAPDDSEVIIRLAFSEHDFGDREAARQLYQKVIDLSSGGKLFEKMDENTIAAFEGLRNLKRKKTSPTEVMLFTRDGHPVEHPSMSWRETHTQSHAKTQDTPNPKRRRRRRKK